MFIGDYRIETIPDTEFRLDGGAMFGVVPRTLWEKVCPPDEFNRIKLNMNCLFIETDSEKILVDTGIGEKWTEKETQRLGIFRQKSFAEMLFERTGYQPSDISIVINTHLHFDHAGGNTILDTYGRTIAQFPNARYFISQSELKHAENPTERDRASYVSENWQPLLENRQIELKPDVYEAVPGLKVEQMRGHNETMQTVSLQCGNEILFSFSDLIPTRHHLPFAWIMSYDLYPTETLFAKKTLLPRAVAENWQCHFYHDLDLPLGRIKESEGRFLIEDTTFA